MEDSTSDEDACAHDPLIIQNDQHSDNDRVAASMDQNTDLISIQSESYDFKVYRRRWYVLMVFSGVVIGNNLFWNTWGPISKPVKAVFHLSDQDVLLLTSMGSIGPLIGAPFATWMMSNKGLRTSVVVTTFLLVAGKVPHLITLYINLNDNTTRLLLVAGQFVSTFPSVVLNGGPPFLSATWFLPNERATATSIGVISSFVGAAIAFIIGPILVVDSCSAEIANTTCTYSPRTLNIYHHQLLKYMYVELAVAVFLLLCVLLYFPGKPPLPPSRSKTQLSIKGFEGLRILKKKYSVWFLMVVFAVNGGIYYSWVSTLNEAVSPFGVSERLAGWLGCSSQLSVIVSALMASRLADIYMRRIEPIITVLYLAATIFQVLFALTCQGVISVNTSALFVYVIAASFFFNASCPLLFELIMEASYPVNEGLTGGISMLLSNVVMVVFFAVFMTGRVDLRWINWTPVLGFTFGLPFFMCYKVRYTRLDIDLNTVR